MNFTLLIQCLLMGLAGLIIHILKGLGDMQKLAAVSNVPFSVQEYFKKEWVSMTISFVVLLMATVGIDEIINWQPVVLKFVKWFFPVVGFAGDVIIFALFGQTKKWLLAIIDRKTNIADSK